MGGNLRTGEESAEEPRARAGKKRKLQEGEGKELSVGGGWGWDGNALPIGSEAQAGGVGRRASQGEGDRGWGESAHP